MEEEPEDYFYYKYCEEEWELFYTFDDISSYIKQYDEEMEAEFSEGKNGEYSEYTDNFDEHCEKMIESCKKALCRVKESIQSIYPELLLTFNIREYFDEEERGEIFEMINGKESSKEYVENVEEFAIKNKGKAEKKDGILSV